ncbi:4Fe-4S ferredoxin iron-sulfur binding domain protein [Desulfofarcimen acetoxidans DSM 771]|uniref:4Fe-4S ferredoxin iron-sulfur binding domain protein n=1 Tax=Desulfofarcimen acetoxidans (strain ATCC 49208 / DSM 771 / KCTC 5769 / VKM B-1644 / 5575) TaxID=485916 RepID=C8W2X7_DESAS|nr:[Fe-Fe] hydrogenase large subunit C-terminal domain-containing protein [Desulfofarcimen acetoxidans]ACV61133.1 4Fe-4S ferredoxin iron-sulfur binding domain protein [Desulfofarcimen acetoxidans DSM 771]
MQKYFHSVRLDEDKCKGCTNCVKRCPTEAIRVREGRALIIEERCIDCGECIKICPNRAKLATTDGLEQLQNFHYTIALPAPSLYAQFEPNTSPEQILGALLNIGFDDIFEVALGAEAVSLALRDYLSRDHPRPMISSACPAVLRLMQVRFPGLLQHIVPIETPMEISAGLAREKARQQHGFSDNQIGVFFITPCPAKVTAIKQPFGEKSYVDGAISMSVIYGELLHSLDSPSTKQLPLLSGARGVGWGKAGGENHAIRCHSHLAVDGIHSIINVLEEIERGGLSDIDYLEAQACTGGCIGGPLAPQNLFVARVRMDNLVKKLSLQPDRPKSLSTDPEFLRLNKPILPRPALKLDQDINRAIEMLEEVEKITEDLPGLDCGSCGSPNCRALAEDIVRGYADTSFCIFKLRQRLQILAREIVDLSHKQPPAMGREREKELKEGDA